MTKTNQNSLASHLFRLGRNFLRALSSIECPEGLIDYYSMFLPLMDHIDISDGKIMENVICAQ